jgi:hypothetical protein
LDSVWLKWLYLVETNVHVEQSMFEQTEEGNLQIDKKAVQ